MILPLSQYLPIRCLPSLEHANAPYSQAFGHICCSSVRPSERAFTIISPKPIFDICSLSFLLHAHTHARTSIHLPIETTRDDERKGGDHVTHTHTLVRWVKRKRRRRNAHSLICERAQNAFGVPTTIRFQDLNVSCVFVRIYEQENSFTNFFEVGQRNCIFRHHIVIKSYY